MGIAGLAEKAATETSEAASHIHAEPGAGAAKANADAAEAALKRDPQAAAIRRRLDEVAVVLEVVSLVPGANIPASLAACAIRLAAGDYSGAVLDLVGIIPFAGVLKVGGKLFPLLKRIAAESFPKGVEVIERLSHEHLEHFAEKAVVGENAGQKVHVAHFREEARLSEDASRTAAQAAESDTEKLRDLLPAKHKAVVPSVVAEVETVGGAERWGVALYPGDYARHAAGTSFSSLREARTAARSAGDWDEVSRLTKVLEKADEEYRGLSGYVQALQSIKHYAGTQPVKDIATHLGLPEAIVQKAIAQGVPSANIARDAVKFDAKSGALVSAAHAATPAIVR